MRVEDHECFPYDVNKNGKLKITSYVIYMQRDHPAQA